MTTKSYLALFLTVCSLGTSVSAARAQKRVSVMTYNVENLFDTKHDDGKNDETFLPLAQKSSAEHTTKCQLIRVEKWRKECLELDWNSGVLSEKLARLAMVIRSANGGQGADIVFLQEVENLAVLTALTEQRDLKKLGYHPVLIEGADARGIDVALLTKFPVVDAKLNVIPFKDIGDRIGDTRGILNVHAKSPSGTIFSLMSVHLPAPFHPSELREQALKFMTELAKSEAKLGYVVIAAGDFNIIRDEETQKHILDPFVGEWQISHRVGCQDCRGSTFYAKDQTWSFLDQIWVYSDSLTKKWNLDTKSIRVVKSIKEQSDPQGAPQSLEIEKGGKVGTGVSDHFPVYLELDRL